MAAATLPAPLEPVLSPIALQPAAPRPPGLPLPRLTVITPSFNQGRYLEATLRSVLLQGYPNLDYIVIDGGSTDSSAAIIGHYANHLAYFVIERDRGQVDAILKGLARATGEWFVWINSDDLLAPGALWRIAELCADTDVVAGTTQYFDDTRLLGRRPSVKLSATNLILEHMNSGVKWHQPAVWLRREPFLRLAPQLGYHYAFDWDWLIRYLHANPRVRHVPDVLAYFRYHDLSKTVGHGPRFRAEQIRILEQLAQDAPFATLRATLDRSRRGALWLQALDALLDDRAAPRWPRFWQVVRQTREDPEARCTGTTRRAARRILRYGGRKPA